MGGGVEGDKEYENKRKNKYLFDGRVEGLLLLLLMYVSVWSTIENVCSGKKLLCCQEKCVTLKGKTIKQAKENWQIF